MVVCAASQKHTTEVHTRPNPQPAPPVVQDYEKRIADLERLLGEKEVEIQSGKTALGKRTQQSALKDRSTGDN